MKFTDRLADSLLKLGLVRAYGLQGGSVAHIMDSYVSLGGSLSFQHHEQHSILAATGDFLTSGLPGLVFVSTGPAGTNALTGLLGAWQDSIPLIVVSGQTRVNELSYGLGVRQVGSQESPIVDLVKPITKKAVCFLAEDGVSECIEDLLETATSARQGPVWLDIPIDLQLSENY
jgi:acetolactate synthase-1/2/3 large subunit